MKAFLAVILLLAAALTRNANGLDNGLGRVPQMGWNSWNHFHCDIDETVTKQTADAMVSTGLAKAGYEYVNLDDCVFTGRDSSGRLIADADKFPSGIRSLADYVHSKGLKFGIYSDAGHETCQGRPGLYGYEQIDADTFAGFGVDYIKVDWCHSTGMDPKERYTAVGKALNQTGRPIFFSMCEWGVDSPWEWAAPVGNSWRTTGDINDSWISVIGILAKMEGLSKYAGPGAWNDPDMLEVGNGGMKRHHYVAHFSLWALMNAPLLAGNDLRSIDNETLEILTNPEVVAVNQDKLGVAGDVVHKTLDVLQVWAKPLSDGSVAVALLNEAVLSARITAEWADLGIPTGTGCTVRDLWEHKDMGTYTNSFSAEVSPESVVMVKITPLH